MVQTWRCRDPAASSGTGDGSWRGPLASPCEQSAVISRGSRAHQHGLCSDSKCSSKTSHHKTQSRPLSAYPRTAPAWAVIILDVRPKMFNSPHLLCSATLSLLFTKQTPLEEVVKLFVQKSYRQKRTFFSLALSRRPLVGLHALLKTVQDKRDKAP
jgi:hypothetical protein